jgi:serine/threonine protein kinase
MCKQPQEAVACLALARQRRSLITIKVDSDAFVHPRHLDYMPPSAGDRLGPYEVTDKIGEGGMGEVYRARDTKLDRDVALKGLLRASGIDAPRVHDVSDVLLAELERLPA